jgi:N-methylhydantoinase B
MLAGNEVWAKEVRALNAGGRLARTFGVNQSGMYYASSLAQPALTGGGARSYADGVDSGQGSYLVAPNVEWLEMNCPLLFLFRRHVSDGQGAGEFRGGAGAEMAFTVHKAPEGKIRGVAFGVAGLKNGGQGVLGGYPGAPSILRLMQGTRLREWLAAGKMPEAVEEVGGQGEILQYCEFDLRPDDVLYYRLGQGGGYGDPIEREAEAVLRDVQEGYVSEKTARLLYGVVLKAEAREVDIAATQKLREELRAARKETEA